MAHGGGGGQMSLTLQKAVNELDMKVQALADVMKRQNGLIPGVAPSKSRDHSEAMLYVNISKILQTFRPPRLPAEIFYPRLIHFGDQFLELREYRLASRECFNRFLAEIHTAKLPDLLSPEDLKSLEIHARMGAATCDFFIALDPDPELRKHATVQEVLALLRTCRDIGVEMGGSPDLYWLIYNNSVTIMTLCKPLLAHGYAPLAVEFLIFAALSMEAQVPLNTTRYLGWRVRLYTAVCLGYEESKTRDEEGNERKMTEEALAFAQRGLEQVQRLAAVEALDPVPPPAEVKKLLGLNELEMRVLVARYTPGGDGGETLEALTAGSLGSTALVVQSVLRVLQDTTRRTIRHQPASEEEGGKVALLEALCEKIQPQLETIKR
eukprot:CAMPEP_0172048972 /NCGR_PEP_ID=MMETSP1043-20130122/1822_1 /TAXON_ID=464988 /ORGANISM="Hemiselmis andersenii, Strain CCMP441" /LENGTH=379 /DNA_ID=CAMNT_0012707919 /DNA_START=155 /DNA_END=1290 /DNA_ORIENTATION=+